MGNLTSCLTRDLEQNCLIEVLIGDHAFSGTNGDIKIKIIGENDQTDFIDLDNMFVDDFTRSSRSTFSVNINKDIGHIKNIVVSHKDSSVVDKNVYVEKISITHNDKHYTFMVHFWISNGI